MPTSETFPYVAGDIVVVPFPFSDRLAEKRRPALVVSSSSLAAEGMVWLVMITTSKSHANPSDLKITDRVASGLKAECFVRPTKIAGLEPTRIARKAGRLSDRDLQAVLANVRAYVAPSRTAP